MGTRLTFAACGTLAVSLLSAQTPAGIRPRAAPGDYAASQPARNVTYAASLLPARQVKRLFAVDISKTYLVFEVACYPRDNGGVKLTPGDFRVRSANGQFALPADAFTVASVIQEEKTPLPPSSRDTTVIGSASVGYENGIDPDTGQRVRGVYTAAGVGVARGPDLGSLGPPPKGSTPYDRRILEDQLADRSLPEGTFAQPVAGLLYFPLDRLKKKSGTYSLEYLGDASGSVRMKVPAKTR